MIEAQARIHLVAAVKRAGVVVQRRGRIALRAQIVGDCFAGRFVQNRGVGILARAEEIDVQAGEHFEFRVRRAAADRGNVQFAARAFARQAVEVRRGVLGIPRTDHGVDVEQRFQLQVNHVRVIEIVLGAEYVRRFLVDLLHDAGHDLGGIVRRLRYAHVAERRRKARREAVLIICVHEIVKIPGERAEMHAQRIRAEAQRQKSAERRKRQRVIHLPAPRKAGHDINQQHRGQEDASIHQYDLRPGVIDGRERDRVLQHQHVHRRKRLRALLRDHEFCNSQRDPRDAHRIQYALAALEQLREGQTRQYDQVIVQKIHRSLGDEPEQLCDAGAVQTLDDQTERQRQQRQQNHTRFGAGGIEARVLRGFALFLAHRKPL